MKCNKFGGDYNKLDKQNTYEILQSSEKEKSNLNGCK